VSFVNILTTFIKPRKSASAPQGRQGPLHGQVRLVGHVLQTKYMFNDALPGAATNHTMPGPSYCYLPRGSSLVSGLELGCAGAGKRMGLRRGWGRRRRHPACCASRPRTWSAPVPVPVTVLKRACLNAAAFGLQRTVQRTQTASAGGGLASLRWRTGPQVKTGKAKLSKGKFTWITEAGRQERWIVASCGAYTVLFNFRCAATQGRWLPGPHRCHHEQEVRQLPASRAWPLPGAEVVQS